MSIIIKEQKFLSEMHDNIKSPEYHKEEVYKATKAAKLNIEKNTINELARYREIIKVSNQYISFYPNVVNYLSLAEAYAKIGNVDEYIAILEKALKIYRI